MVGKLTVVAALMVASLHDSFSGSLVHGVSVRGEARGRALFGEVKCRPGYYLKEQELLASYCVKCEGCGAYSDTYGSETACKVANIESCPTGSVPAHVQGATSLSQACQKVETGSFFSQAQVKGTECFEVKKCIGPALYTETPGQSQCKDYTEECKAKGLLPRLVYSGFKADSDLLCVDADTPGFATHGDAIFRECAGCGSYFENGECKTATKASCASGTFPIVNIGAKSLQEACASLPEDYVYDEEECVMTPCASTSPPIDKSSMSLPCSQIELASLSPTSTCNDIVTNSAYMTARTHSWFFLIGMGITKRDFACDKPSLLAANPQCKCPVVTTSKPTVKPTPKPTDNSNNIQVTNSPPPTVSPTSSAGCTTQAVFAVATMIFLGNI